MKNLLHAFAPLTVLSAACKDLYISDLPAPVFVPYKTKKALKHIKRRLRKRENAKRKN